MKMCVIGAGAQGSVIAKILAEDPEIDKVVLADINTQLLQRVAKRIDSSEISTERVDAGNSDDLAKVFKGADVAVNATLMRYNLPIFHSALKHGANYIDFAEDWPIREKFLEQLKTSACMHACANSAKWEWARSKGSLRNKSADRLTLDQMLRIWIYINKR